MHVYLPEKYRPPFLHGVFLFSKVGVLVVNFDGFFILAYSSPIMWVGPLGSVWCYHTSMSTTLYLKGCQICPTFSLEKESWNQPYHVFLIAPQPDHAPQVLNWVYFGVRICESKFGLFIQGNVFMQNFWNFQVISTTKIILISIQANSFWKNSSDSYGEVLEVMKAFYLAFGEKYEVTSGWS